MIRRAFRPRLLLKASLFAAALLGCSFMHDQVAYTTTSSCMKRECTKEQGVARQQCESECSRRYAK